jgi:hypothetical protein
MNVLTSGNIDTALHMSRNGPQTLHNNDQTSIGEEVHCTRNALTNGDANDFTEATQEDQALASETRSELSINERLLAAAQFKIATKENEIRTKTNKANARKE